MSNLILASASRHRAKILDSAGITFAQIPSQLDERAIDAPLEEADIAPEKGTRQVERKQLGHTICTTKEDS